MKRQLTMEALYYLRENGFNLAAIGRMYGCSREWVRQLANRWGIKNKCLDCKKELDSNKKVRCDECWLAARRRNGRIRSKLYRGGRKLLSRPVIKKALSFFTDLGIPVEVDLLADVGQPELIIGKKIKVKCFKAWRSDRLKGILFRRIEKINTDYYFLSDLDDLVLVIPANELEEGRYYIGVNSPLWEFGRKEWFEELVRRYADVGNEAYVFT